MAPARGGVRARSAAARLLLCRAAACRFGARLGGRQHRDRLDLEQRAGPRKLRNRHRGRGRRRLHVQLGVAHRAEDADVAHVDEVVVDLHDVGKSRANRSQCMPEVLEGAFALRAEIAGPAHQPVLEIEAELAGDVDGAAGARGLDHVGIARRRRHRLWVEKAGSHCVALPCSPGPQRSCISPSRSPSHLVVGAWIRIVIRMAMNVTEAMICAPGAFMPSRSPASAAGMTPVSRVQHMNSISLKLHFARRSGSAQANTVTGRATNMKISTTMTPPNQYCAIKWKSTCAPSSMKMNRRMMKAVVPTYSSCACSSAPLILNPNVSLLPMTMPNTNTAMKPLACKPSAAK